MISRAFQDITSFIFMDDAPEKCDIILIPGTSKSAITEKAAELYRLGYAPYIMPSGLYSSSIGKFASDKIDNPKYYGEFDSDFEYCKHILMKNGVPEKAIIREDRATNTMENAAFSAQVIKETGISVTKAIICCQSFHARRAFLAYTCHFKGVTLSVVPTSTQGISKDNWYLTEKGYKKVMGEVAKCGMYFKDMHEFLR